MDGDLHVRGASLEVEYLNNRVFAAPCDHTKNGWPPLEKSSK
jgi:hypothetical protein